MARSPLKQEEHWLQGKQWYHEAHDFCLNLARDYNLPLDRVVGCLAALSPQCSWAVNKRATENLIVGRELGYSGYKTNVATARAILWGGENVVDILNVNKRYGNKVRAFYYNVLDPNAQEG